MAPARFSRAFTLIEMMICVAILTIVLTGVVSARNSFQWLRRDADYREALRQGRRQAEALRRRPFDALPPKVATVPPSGALDLAETDLVPGSVTLRAEDGTPYPEPVSVDAKTGLVQVDPALAGHRMVVSYSFWMADQGEAHTAAPGVTLANVPVLSVQSVMLATGEKLSPLPRGSWDVEAATGRLSLPASAAGHAVLVDYLGGRIHNQVSGRYLGRNLEAIEGEGPLKLVTVEESYGESPTRMRLSVLVARP